MLMPLDPTIRSLIAQFRRSPKWDDQLDLELIQRFWPDLVGDQLAAATKITALQGSTVVLNVPDLIWRKQLMRMKRPLLQKVNAFWDGQKITEIALTYEN
jgi:predicted nucleic acid-binding Zn ribbon protein